MTFVSALVVMGCGEDNSSSQDQSQEPAAEKVQGTVSDEKMSYDESAPNLLVSFANTGCKQDANTTRAESFYSKETIVYEATQDGGLIVHHNNILYGCTAEISSMANIQGNIIEIYEKTEHNADVDCVCPYDLKMEVGGLKQGSYTLVIGGNSCHTITIPIEYTTQLKGEFVVRE